jgi:hypothetical protein
MLSIAGTQINPQPSKMSISIMDISNAERNLAGDMLIDRITTKRKISLSWAQLTNAQIPVILQKVNPVFFSVSYPDPYTGTIQTKTFYVGDRTMPVYRYNNGAILWEGLSLDLIEK